MKLILSAALFAVAAGTAYGADNTITFTAPLQVKNVPSTYDKISVGCTVFDGAKQVVGWNGLEVPLDATGSANTNLTIVVTSVDPQLLNTAKSYQCTMFAHAKGGSKSQGSPEVKSLGIAKDGSVLEFKGNF